MYEDNFISVMLTADFWEQGVTENNWN